jgi:hypothetical protein
LLLPELPRLALVLDDLRAGAFVTALPLFAGGALRWTFSRGAEALGLPARLAEPRVLTRLGVVDRGAIRFVGGDTRAAGRSVLERLAPTPAPRPVDRTVLPLSFARGW